MRFYSYYEFSALSGRTFEFHKQNSILGGLRRKVEVRGSPGHQETRQCAKTGNTRPCFKTHGRAHKKPQAPATREVARPHRAWWHGRATTHGWPCHHARVAVRPTHGRAWGGAARLSGSSRFFRGACFIPPFFLVFPRAFRVFRERF